MQKLLEPEPFSDKSIFNGVVLSSHVCDEIPKSDASSLVLSTDYSSMFGEEFSLSENQFDGSFLNILDIAAVEEGILHVLYAAASQVNYLFVPSSYLSPYICHYIRKILMFFLICNYSLSYVASLLKLLQTFGLSYHLCKLYSQVMTGPYYSSLKHKEILMSWNVCYG